MNFVGIISVRHWGPLPAFKGFLSGIDYQCTLMVSHHKQEHGEITIETLTPHERHDGHGNAFHVSSPLQEELHRSPLSSPHKGSVILYIQYIICC